MQRGYLYTSLMKMINEQYTKTRNVEKPKQPYLVQQTQRQEQSSTKYSKNMAAKIWFPIRDNDKHRPLIENHSRQP